MRAACLLLCSMALLFAASQISSAKLLFKSGFEPDTTVTTPATHENCVSLFSGKDKSTGYSWPINLGPFMEARETGIQNLFASGTAPNPVTYYQEPTIETAAGPHGKPTHVLHLSLKHDNPDFGADQHNFKLGFASEPMPALYYRYWIKFDTKIVGEARANANYWRHVWEMKACIPKDDPRDKGCHIDQRLITRIQHDPATGEPVWTFIVDYYEPRHDVVFFERYAMTPRELEKLANGDWFLMEAFFERHPDRTSKGRFFWKIDGRTILDKQDLTYWGTLDKAQVFQMPFMIYGGGGFTGGDLWVDDLEIHDSIPEGGAPGAPGSPKHVAQ